MYLMHIDVARYLILILIHVATTTTTTVNGQRLSQETFSSQARDA